MVIKSWRSFLSPLWGLSSSDITLTPSQTPFVTAPCCLNFSSLPPHPHLLNAHSSGSVCLKCLCWPMRVQEPQLYHVNKAVGQRLDATGDQEAAVIHDKAGLGLRPPAWQSILSEELVWLRGILTFFLFMATCSPVVSFISSWTFWRVSLDHPEKLCKIRAF